MKRIILVTAVLLSILLNACLKQKEIKIDQETKDYCLFAEGSYWLYQDSATLKIDSVVINNPIRYDFTRSKVNGCVCEYYKSSISFYAQDNRFYSEILLTTGSADPDILKPCILMKNIDVMYHNGDVSEIVPNYFSIILLERKENYSINGINYSDVKIFKNERCEYYWAKNIGLIRTEIHKEDSIIVKNLIKYNVKPYNK